MYIHLACIILVSKVNLISKLNIMKTDTLGFSFLQIANNYRNLLEKEMNKYELHYGQITVLSLLWENDGLSQKELSIRLSLSQPTINKMVKSLAQNDFVSCNQCQKDGRIMRVFLTQKGREAENLVTEASQLLQTDFFSSLTETEQLIFKQICDKLRGNAVSLKAAG